jgi:hypothetical protein
LGLFLSPFNTTFLPLDVTDDNSYGSFAFDANGNLLFVADSANEIRLLDRSTGTVTTVATGVPGNDRRSITYQDSIFVGGSNGDIYQVDPTDGSSTLLTTISHNH